MIKKEKAGEGDSPAVAGQLLLLGPGVAQETVSGAQQEARVLRQG